MSNKNESDKKRHESESVHEEIVLDSGPLFVIFGGMANRNAQPPFEFRKITRTLNVNRIFLRDSHQCWYHAGLPGIGNSIDHVARFLKARIRQLNPSSVVFLGNSMGGYAAILFSSLLATGDVLAFAPQTFLSPIQRLRSGDKRWTRAILRTYVKCFTRSHAKFFDLKRVLNANPLHGRSVRIYVSNDCSLDKTHCENIASIPGVEINNANEGGHQFIQRMRKSGELRSILLAQRPAA